jgi:calcineurin-like phosphoesterase family protein
MDEIIINNWNSVINKNDTIYHLGDFCFGDPKKYLKRLNGNIIRLKGDHDRDIRQPYMIILKPNGLLDEYGNQRSITLCHWSMRTWYKSHYASWHLFAHSHGKLESMGLSFDCGMDTNNFYPYSLKDVKSKMSKLKPIVDFREKNI